MRLQNNLWATICATVLLGGIPGTLLAQISYGVSTFDSYGYAVTDAGSQYAYQIDNSDEVIGPDTYSFQEFGQAPGYSSSASVGAEHEATLATNSITLFGKASTYVSDDYGYAACSSEAEVGDTIRFTLTKKRTKVVLKGSLFYGGNSTPDYAFQYFVLKNSAGATIATSNGGDFTYQGQLPAGGYTLSISTYVAKSIDFSGGDVYDSSTSTYQIHMTAQ